MAEFNHLDELRCPTSGEPLQFEIDKAFEKKLLVSSAPEGYLKRVDL